MPGRCSVIPGDVWLTRLSGNRITGCERPNARLSRAADWIMIERHGHINEYMFVNHRWRRRLQALLGRDMADDGRSAPPTVNAAET